jgi:hypothetical protein
VSPGNVGVPDRIVFFSGGIFLVETKSTTGRLRTMQKKQKEWLAERGAEVVVLNSKAKVEAWVDMQTKVLSRLTLHNSVTEPATDVFDNWHKNWIT